MSIKNLLIILCIVLGITTVGLSIQVEILRYQNMQQEQQIEEYAAAEQEKIDRMFMCKLASYYGGNAKQRAYNMQVILNKQDEHNSIQQIVLHQLYEVEGITAYEFEELIFTDSENINALSLIYQYNLDETSGSTEFKKWK